MKANQLPVLALAATFAAVPALAHADPELELEEAEIFFELNDTDHDLGIHGFADGDEWKELEIENPWGRELLEVDVKSRLKRQGLTEIFFESAEPTFGELKPRRFFRRFPQGYYEIEVETLDGRELENEVYLSHVIPAAPDVVSVGGALGPEIEDGEAGCYVPVNDEIVINWAKVTMSHAAKHGEGGPDPREISLGIVGDVEVISYEIAIEVDETPYKSTTIVPANVTQWTVPEDFIDLAEDLWVEDEDTGNLVPVEEIKFEILVRVDNGDGNPGNKSAVESCFDL